MVAIDEEIIRGSDRRSGIEKYGQDDADAFLALDEQSGEDRGWKQFSIVQNPCWSLFVDDRGFTSSTPRIPTYQPTSILESPSVGCWHTFPIHNTSPTKFQPSSFSDRQPSIQPEEAEHEDEEDEDVMALKPFEDESSKPRGSRGAKKTAKSKCAESEESEPDLEPLSSWAAIKQNPCWLLKVIGDYTAWFNRDKPQ